MRITVWTTGVAALGGLLVCTALAPPRSSAVADEGDGALRGTAHVAEGPAAEAEVAAGIIGWAPAAGDGVAVVKTDAEGKFALTQPPLGPIDVWVRPKGGKWRFAIRMWQPGVNDLDIDASPTRGFGGMGGMGGGSGTVTGTVTDKGGKPIAGAAVGLRGDDSTWVVTDDKGQFTLEKAADGDGLVARASGFRDFVLQKVKIEKKRMTIQLAAAKPTTVHVTDPAGQPLAGAWVVLGNPDDVQSTTGFSALFPPRARLVGGWTDAKGDAHVAWGHTEDKTIATAYAPHFAPATKAITAGGAAVSLQLAAMRPARATVVLKTSAEPLAGVFVGLPHASDGGADAISALPQDAERGPVVVGRTDEKGQCVIADLDPKVTTLRVVGEMKVRANVKLERMP
jgi:hypothetical protein